MSSVARREQAVKLPNSARVEIPERKLVDYLLSRDHHPGQRKAAFFASFGFTRERWQLLAGALRAHAATHEVVATIVREAGRLYVVEGPLEAPDGRAPHVRMVWCIDEGAAIPRLITAYPVERIVS